MGAAKIAITPGVVTGGVIIGVAVVMTLLLVNFASMTYIPSGFIGLVSGFIVMLALAKFTKLGHPKTHEMY